MRDLFDRLLNDYPDLAGVTGNSVKGWGSDPNKQYDLKYRIVEGKDIIVLPSSANFPSSRVFPPDSDPTP